MALPERLFYTLDQAGKILNCTIEDLLYFGYAKVCQFCFILPNTDIDLCVVSTTKILSNLTFEKYTRYKYITPYTYLEENTRDHIEAGEIHIDGLLAISPRDCEILYKNFINKKSNDIEISAALIPRVASDVINSTKDYDVMDIYFSEDLSLNLTQLFITNYEMELLKNGGRNIELDAYFGGLNKFNGKANYLNLNNLTSRIDNTPTNLQIEFIRNLLFLKYGEDAIENPRNFIEKNKSPLVRDFELNGLKYPSGKSLEKWLKK